MKNAKNLTLCLTHSDRAKSHIATTMKINKPSLNYHRLSTDKIIHASLRSTNA